MSNLALQKLRKGRVAALAVLCCALLLTPSVARAGNTVYWGYQSYATSRYVTYTAARSKENDSKSYNRCQRVTQNANHTVEVVGNENSQSKFVGSPVYSWRAGQEGYLSNYVYESGYDWAQLWFNNIVSFDITIEGMWKADTA